MGWRGVPLFKGTSNIFFLKLTGEDMSVDHNIIRIMIIL